MNCTTVRDRLAELALGALPGRDAVSVDRHLTWCAACRKEARELKGASATLAFALAPSDPPADLQGRVIERVRTEVAARDDRPHPSRRHGRLVLVASFAGVLAVFGTGWGAVMANRAANSERLARQEENRSQSAIERFRDVLNWVEFGDPENEVFISTLGPRTQGGGGGSALTLVSPSIIDMAIVLVNGVPPETRDRLPFTVRLRDGARVLTVGRIEKGGLDDSGAGTVMREFEDLTGFDRVIVRDARGDVVLQGTMEMRATVTSPAP